MSSGTNPAPAPTPAPTDWVKVISVLIAAMIAAWNAHGFVNPPAPFPSPVPIVVPPVPVPAPPIPTPPPIPAPTPSPAPIVVPSVVTVVDSSGNPIVGPVPVGKMFIASADSGVVLTPDKSSGSYDIDQTADNRFSGTLESGQVLEIVVTGKGKPFIFRIKSNTAPQPPPTPIPPPGPNPSPAPVSSGLLSISVVEDPVTRTNLTAAVLNDVAFWNGLQAKGHKVRIYAPSTPEIGGIKAVNATKSASITPPSLVIADQKTGNVLTTVVLPNSIPAIQQLITGLGG